MSIDERNENSKGMQRFRATMHIGMGAFYVILGMLIFYVKAFGAMELSTPLAYGISGLMLLYGGFRIWRGFVDVRMMNKRDQRNFNN